MIPLREWFAPYMRAFNDGKSSQNQALAHVQ
jgi:hypothetical protein